MPTRYSVFAGPRAASIGSQDKICQLIEAIEDLDEHISAFPAKSRELWQSWYADLQGRMIDIDVLKQELFGDYPCQRDTAGSSSLRAR